MPSSSRRSSDRPRLFGPRAEAERQHDAEPVDRIVARDLDVLRVAVGDDKLNFLGYSYGTFIGATYAERFPDQIPAMVLDGAIDP